MNSTAVSSANLEAVKALYAAFGRGDIPAILELMSEDVRFDPWADSFAHRAGVPWLEPRSGRDGVGRVLRARRARSTSPSSPCSTSWPARTR